jgi:hypothetical protein
MYNIYYTKPQRYFFFNMARQKKIFFGLYATNTLKIPLRKK